jgi:hypothetical protein
MTKLENWHCFLDLFGAVNASRAWHRQWFSLPGKLSGVENHPPLFIGQPALTIAL